MAASKRLASLLNQEDGAGCNSAAGGSEGLQPHGGQQSPLEQDRFGSFFIFK